MAAIEAEGLRRTYRTHTGTVRRRADLRGAELVVGAIYGIAGYALLRWFEVLSRRHASLERS